VSNITYATIYTEGLGDAALSDAFESRLHELRARRATLHGHRIGRERSEEGQPFDREDPVDPTRIVSRGVEAGPEVIAAAVEASRRAQPGWAALSQDERNATLARIADVVRERYVDLAALVSLETGKARGDALAEVEECGVMVELYVEQASRSEAFEVPMKPPSGGAQTRVVLRPYGVFGVISPFNFPMAIPLSMVLSALITGNGAVHKPSALTPECGQAFHDLLTEIGLPDGLVNMVQGGPTTGAALAESSIDGIVFTGSAEVGLELTRRLSAPPFVRPVVAEMGGKNPAIITGAGDLDVAARAVALSAFGGTGQKCNGCSRAVVTADVHDEFVERIAAIAGELKVGDPADRTVFTGPLSSAAAVERFERSIASARERGRVVAGGTRPHDAGYFVDLTVVEGLPAGHPLTREELFLPFLTVTKVASFDAAIDEANDVRYGLSAGLFSEDPDERERFLAEIQAGIVFLNNPGGATTGVWPGSQTMAGWKASGSSGKGGFGPWYLHQFAREQSRTVFD
jgi:1-pyrroline-5-carboxylate dehydrogenase